MDKELKQWQGANCVSEEGGNLCFYADDSAFKKGKPCCTKPGYLKMDGMGNCLSFRDRKNER